MKKQDLKDGMIVELESGARRMKLGDKLISYYSWVSIDDFEDDLSNSFNKEDSIKKVFESSGYNFDSMFSDSYLTLIYEKKEFNKVDFLTAIKALKEDRKRVCQEKDLKDGRCYKMFSDNRLFKMVEGRAINIEYLPYNIDSDEWIILD